MVRVTVQVRELGGLKPDYSLEFELPEVPKAGSYISIHRSDRPSPFSEDMIVRKIWWRLQHSETRAGPEDRTIGTLSEIVVECDQALGPYASDRWRASMEAAKARGVEVEEFQVSRFSVREIDLQPKK